MLAPWASRNFLPRFSSGRSSTAPKARDLLSIPLALISRHLADSLSRELGSLKRCAAHWTLLRLRALIFLTKSWTSHPVGDQLVTALNQAQVEAVEPVMTDSIFALEGCRIPIAWFDLKRWLQTMIISYSGDAVQRGLDIVPDQVSTGRFLPRSGPLKLLLLWLASLQNRWRIFAGAFCHK